jgi:hypothetical protein
MRVRQVFAALSAVLLIGLGSADAAKKKKKAAPRAKAKTSASATIKNAPKANTQAVASLMGPFKWGMSPDEVGGVIAKQIDEKYQERIKETRDVYQQDKFRKDATREKNALKKTYVKFDGRKTGWDVSIIDKEFGQKNDESMLYYWENDPDTKKDQKRFFFFVDGKLWKMFIAFNSDLFQGKKFADFQASMETRYGKGADEMRDDVHFLAWRSPGYFLRAIDLTQFYGNFCVAIADDSIEQTIHARREERNPKQVKTSVIVDSVTEGKNQKDESKPSLEDPNADVVDRLTGSK